MPKAIKKPILPTTTKAELLEKFKDFPAINVISRRFDNPHDPGSLAILLKDEPADPCLNSEHQRRVGPKTTRCLDCGKPVRLWNVHWCNTDIEERWSQIKSRGYVPVLAKDLKDKEEVSGLVKQVEEGGAEYVRRGDHGKQILMKQPLPVYNYIKSEAARKQKMRFASKRAMQSDLAESAGRELGDEAGQLLHDGGIQVESMSRQRTTLGAEAGADD